MEVVEEQAHNSKGEVMHCCPRTDISEGNKLQLYVT